MSYADRFWSKVNKNGPVPQHCPYIGECWEWTGRRSGSGYGTVVVFKKQQVAHRVAWGLANGPIPDGMLVCHRCDNPVCVRPDHLFLGTHLDNMRDMWAKGRARPGIKRGTEQSQAKLTDERVCEIRQKHKAGLGSYRSLAREYGVGETAIARIVRNERWRHVGADSPDLDFSREGKAVLESATAEN